MAAPDERTGLLKAASPLESVARDKATSGEHKEHHLEVEPRVMQVAAELVEALESTSKNDKLQESGAALLAAQIRSNLRTPDQLIILAYLLILPLFERPLWCFFDSHCGKDVNVPDSGMPRLPWAGSVAIDLAVLLFCASLLALRIVSNGWAKLARSPWRIAELVLVSVGLLDVLLIYAVRHEAVLWIPFIRPLLFVVKNSNVQSVVQQLIMAAPQVANVLFLLAINIFLFGWLGVLLFWKTDCDPNKAGNQGCSVNPQFTALGQSFQNLYISLAFANILDLIRDSKAAKPVWVLYMFAFVVSSIWILQSLVLAVIYNVYRKTEEERKKEKEERVKNELKAAFKRLDVAGKGYLETAVIKQLFEAFGRLHLTTHITATQFDLMYDLLDANNDDQVQEEEFLEVFEVLNMRFKKKRTPKKFFHDCLHFFYKSSWYQVFEASIKSNVFEYIIDAFVALTALLLFIQTIYLLKNKDTVIFTDLDLIVTIFFTIQLLLKLVAYGPHEFWDRLYFRFDLFVTVLMVVAEIVQHASPSTNSRTIVRWVMVLRVLGVVRLLSHFKTFVLVFTSLRKLQKQIPTLALSFFVLLAFFSVVGMMSFGGIIKCVPSGNDNNSTTVPPLYLFGDEDLPSCDDDDLHYLATLNFNDLYNSICTLFAVMTSGDWTNIVHPILDRTSQWGQIYFYAFYILVNLAVLNLFVGFVIDSFLDTFKETEAAEEDMSKWKARMKKGNLEKMEGQQEEIERIN